MNPWYAVIAMRAGHRCEYCHAPEAVFNFPFEVEHIIAVSRGGESSSDNFALACRACNLHKAAHLVAIDPQSSMEVPLFHPRRDDWAHHFQSIREQGRIEGLTPSGRATVVRFEMNSAMQVLARQQWTRLGLFP